MSGAYYNEIDPHAAAVLRNLIDAGEIPPGDVDERSIVDIHPGDLRNYTQCHFFAGIGGHAAVLRRVGWRDDRPVWTGSPPCQGISRAGKKLGFDDARHLWPALANLIGECRPPVFFGEQSPDSPAWQRLVQGDLEGMDYAVGSAIIEAAGAGAEHRRARFYFVADRDDEPRRLEQQLEGRRPEGPRDESDWGVVGYDASDDQRRPGIVERSGSGAGRGPSAGDGLQWFCDNKGKARRAPPGIRMLAHGVSGKLARCDANGEVSFYARIAALRGFGNAIDLRPMSQFVAACMEVLVPLFIAALTALIAVAAIYNGHGGTAGIG
jgi:DNA (cytosine-5)-methyltransferase 1